MAPTHLIVVCCHGIWLGGPSRGQDESEWLIADFQRGETPTFIEHIKAGIKQLSMGGEDAVLSFSGGPTRKETRLSEAQSYANIAQANSFWDLPLPSSSSSSHQHILVEERALDSYHNILFSLTLFFSRFGAWPRRLTIVSHGFKRPRLIDGHCAALGWPLDRVDFIGIDPPAMAAAALLSASRDGGSAAGEGKEDDALKGVALAVGEWMDDPHGRGESLRGKRLRRNPWGIWQGVFDEGVEDHQRVNARLLTTGKGDQESLVDDEERPWV